jgi:hypothetical protein
MTSREVTQEREGTMRIWNTWTRNASSRAGKVVMALAFASTIGGVFVAPAFGKDNDRNDNDRNNSGHHDNDRHDNDRRQNYRDHGRRVYQPPPRYYPAPVYVPPPVVYTPAPYQSPGISLFFPFFTR